MALLVWQFLSILHPDGTRWTRIAAPSRLLSLPTLVLWFWIPSGKPPVKEILSTPAGVCSTARFYSIFCNSRLSQPTLCLGSLAKQGSAAYRYISGRGLEPIGVISVAPLPGGMEIRSPRARESSPYPVSSLTFESLAFSSRGEGHPDSPVSWIGPGGDGETGEFPDRPGGINRLRAPLQRGVYEQDL